MNKDSDSDQTQLRRNAEAHIKQDMAQTPSSPGAVETSRLVHELQVHQVELELQNHALQKIRRELEQSLERYTHLYDFAPVGYATLASGGVIQEINLAGAALLGTERAHLIGRRFGLFLSEATRPTFNAFLDQVLVGVAQQSCQVVLTFESAPSHTVQLEGIGLTPDEDRRCHIALLDITERQRAEETLRASEEKYRTVADFTYDWEYWLDPNGQYRYVSPACERITGYPSKEFLTTPGLMQAITHPEDQERVAWHNTHVQKGPVDRLDFRIITREGQERWIGHICQPVYSPEGRFLGRRGSNRDITERKRTYEQLRDSTRQVRSLFENVPIGMFQSTPQGHFIFVNPALAIMLGFDSPEQTIETINRTSIAEAVYEDPARRPQLVQEVEQRTGNWKTFENRYRRQDGSVFDATLCFCEQPDPISGENFLYGFVQDVSERKRVEGTLQRSEEQYRAVIETSPDGFWMLDTQGRLLEVNETYAQLSGYSRAELLSMSIFELEATENSAETLAHIDKILQQGNDLFQTWHRAKNGRLWLAEVNVCYWPRTGDRFFAFIRDVFHRQRSEALLKIRMNLSQIAISGTLDDLIQAALDEAERLTGSTVGFFHFVEPDQECLTLQTWSSHTLKVCQALGKGQHYPVSQAGVWADCLRQLRPMIHNDYASLPHLQGLPDGHVPLLRELTLPLLVDGRVAAIIGVGNKPENYTDDDVEAMQQLTDLMMDIIERKHAQNRAEYLAYHDALTQLPNRTLLADRLQQAMAQARRDGQKLAVCYLDLDDFKPINDTYGHEQGDQVLIEVAHRLKESIRGGDTVARWGGDEFVLLLGDLADIEECEHAVDRVLTTLQTPFTVAGQSVLLSASIGVTLYPDDGSDPDTLLRHVDQAMYQAKQVGGHRYRWFEAD